MHNSLYVKLSKYKFAESLIEYLGHLISKDGVAIDTEKIKAILEWLVPSIINKLG